MATHVVSLPTHWQYYSTRATEVHTSRTGARAAGGEEQLWETLSFIATKRPFTDDDRARLDRLPHNRGKKYRRTHTGLPTDVPTEAADPTVAAEVRDEVDRLRSYLSDAQWDIERRLADGQSYAAIGRVIGVREGTLKVRVSRWRSHVRARLG